MGKTSIRAYNLDCESRKVQSRRSRDLKTRPPSLKPELFHLTTMHQRYLLAACDILNHFFHVRMAASNGEIDGVYYNYIIEISTLMITPQ